jgi:hypothetical protein
MEGRPRLSRAFLLQRKTVFLKRLLDDRNATGWRTLQLQPQLQLDSSHDPPGDRAERRQCGDFTPDKKPLTAI